jgi:hypothetical protein
MKTRYVIWGICALLAIGGVWLGRAMWRAHRQLVTLDVYRMPLSDVLRKIERQTWTKVRADENLNALITLRVVDQPLATVLERVAGQAGARLTTVFAAYVSKGSVGALESALRKNGKIESAGWTKVAPVTSKLIGPDADEAVDSKAGFDSGNGEPRKKFKEPETADTFVAGPMMRPPPGEGPMGGGVRMMVRSGPNGVTIMDDGNGTIEEWSPAELLVESAVKTRLAKKEIETINDEEAAEAAKAIHGDWTKFYVLRKTKFAGFHQPPPPGGGPGRRPDFEKARREPLERFANLTPQERVQRARRGRGPVRIEQNN